MAPITVYGNPYSTCTQRVITALKACDVEYEVVPQTGLGWIKEPEYIANHQPFGQMPAIVDGTFKLFESRAIATYIVLKYGSHTGLVPPTSDVEAHAKYANAISIEAFNFDPSASKIASELVFKVMHGGKTDEAIVAASAATLDSKLKAYNQILSTQKYLAGDHITLADLFHLPYGTFVAQLGKLDGLKNYEHVARWWSDISGYAPWQYALGEAKKAEAAMHAGAAK